MFVQGITDRRLLANADHRKTQGSRMYVFKAICDKCAETLPEDQVPIGDGVALSLKNPEAWAPVAEVLLKVSSKITVHFKKSDPDFIRIAEAVHRVGSAIVNGVGFFDTRDVIRLCDRL